MVPNSAPSGGGKSGNSNHCSACGTQFLPGANFCPQCGSVVGKSTLPAYCMTCGESFDSDDEYCSSCGTQRQSVESAGRQTPAVRESENRGTAVTGFRQQKAESAGNENRFGETDSETFDVETRQMFRRRVREHIDNGWEITEDYGHEVVLTERDIGSIPGHAALLLFTGGVGNLVYGWYNYSLDANTRRLSVGNKYSEPTRASGGVSTSASNSERYDEMDNKINDEVDYEMDQLTAGFASSVMMCIGLVSLITGSPAGMAMGLTLITISIGLVPAIRERLRRSCSITSFGRQRHVDHQIRNSNEECEQPCIVCGEEFRDGVIRHRRDETVVFGVPVRIHGQKSNSYCADCAQDEPIEGIPPADETGWLVGVESESASGPDTESSSGQTTNQRSSRGSRSQTAVGSHLTESARSWVNRDIDETDRERFENN